ncbi:MAG TPA: GspH/FimT family protein [Verrucomicrobiae bacterium]|jgi:type II secretion system protein H|nr:GspH/FimT family protein [Verrucomicrobiae bacterium]
MDCSAHAKRQHRSRHICGAQRRAFTLIELILVLALLVITTSLVAPAMSNFIRGRALDAEARRFISLTRGAQSRAVSEGMPIMLWVDEKAGTYGMEEETPGANGDTKAETLTLDDTLQIAVLTTGAGAQTTLHSLPAIKFLADGTIDENSPQTVQLTHENGGVLWLGELRNHMGYEIRDTEK